jgi:hypothetical protein
MTVLTYMCAILPFDLSIRTATRAIGSTGSTRISALRGLRLVLCLVYVYIYYIHPELGIGNCPFRLGKGAGPL